MDVVRIVDAAMADAVVKGGAWVVCRPGCTSCCFGAFEITIEDAARLREGLSRLDRSRAAQILDRAAKYGDGSGQGDDDPCPVLNPATGLCELYEHRPLLCRTFGPATRIGSSIGVCHLCFEGASDAEIVAAAVEIAPEVFDSAEHLTVAQALINRE